MTPPDNAWPEYAAASEGQRLAALPTHSAWVEANAGSGKTKVLIDRVARLLLKRVEPDSILCVTYTKAAASEMQSRLFARLGDWCVMDDAKLRKELASLEHRPETDYDHDDIGRARELFAKALETPGGLRIETIHAFSGRVLRRFPLEAGIAPGFSELDDDDAADIWDASFRAMGRRVVRGDQALVEAARFAAEAGGGKGFEAVRSLLPRRAAIQRYIASAGDIDAAVERLAREIGAPALGTAELLDRAMGAELPRKALQDLLGAIPTAKKSDAELAATLATALSDAPASDRFAAYASLAFTAKGDQRKSNPYTADALKQAPAVALFFQIKDVPQGSEIHRIYAIASALNAARLFERSAALLRLADVLFDEFDRRKRARAGLDFDDLIETTSRLLTRRHAAEWVLWKLDGGISHILLDEAQDTSPAQWKILKALTDDIFSGHGAVREERRTLFVVGDRKQSIYSFQGADPEHFLLEKQTFETSARTASVDFELPDLAMSFRSSPEVLNYVDAVFDTDVFTPDAPFTIAPPDVADLLRHTSFRRNEPGSVELWPLEPRHDVEPAEPWTAPKGQESAASPKARLATRIAKFIRREIDAGAAVWDRKEQRPCRPGDFLILVRGRTGGLFDGILQALKRENIPVAGADRIQLLDSLAVQDLLNLVRFALCPEDDLALAEILKGPFGGLNDEQLFAIANPRERHLWAAVQEANLPVTAFLANVLERRHQPPFEFLTHALERGAGLPRPGWELILSRFGGPAREPVTALIDRAAAFDAGEAPSLQLFLDAIERRGGEVKRELSGPQDEVRVMTVHGAKGLEAPIVILPDTCSAHRGERDGVFMTEDDAPIWAGPKTNDIELSAKLRAVAEARALREHRRLLYVALTRAQDRLIVCGAFTGHPKGAGHTETSWYTIAQSAMQRLVTSGAASEAEDGDRAILRFGAAPQLLIPAVIAARSGAQLPAWLTRPITLEFKGRVLSPSNLSTASEPPVISPFGAGRAERLRRGSLIHMMFEVLPELPPKSRRKAAEAYLKKQPDLSPAQRKEMLESTLGVLEDKAFAAVFAQGGRAEAPVIGRIGDNTISGRVDRLVVTDAEILIVDYKTDRPSPPDISGVGEAYIAQLAAYRAVLTQRWPNRPIRCLLVWTDGPRLMEIPPSALDRALRAMSQ
ncbi:MAG: double-strand break repair helicase AddA [Hyphomonadaceae bacterium]